MSDCPWCGDILCQCIGVSEARKRPRCGTCGRLAAKDVRDGFTYWVLSCTKGNEFDGWEHE